PHRQTISLAAGELVAQRLERLVGGQRAACGGVRLGLRLRGIATGGSFAAALRIGLLRLGDLPLVRLPALMRLGVLLLPDSLSFLVAFLPLPGLRIEAVGVDVVALVVVGG